MTTQAILMHEESERQLISAVMEDGKKFGAVSMIEPNDFALLKHKVIWQAFIELNQAGRPIDNVTVANCLKSKDDGNQTKLDLIGGPTALTEIMLHGRNGYNAVAYADIVKEYSSARSLINQFAETSKNLYGSKVTIQTALQEVLAKAQQLQAQLIVDERTTVGDTANDIFADVLAGKPVPTYKTGISSLDRVLNGGGFKRKNFIVVAGRPGDGKTAILKQMAIALAEQYTIVEKYDVFLDTTKTEKKQLRVLYFNFESSERDLVTRMYSQLSGINQSWISNAKVPPRPSCPKCAGTGYILKDASNCDCYKNYTTTYHEKLKAAQATLNGFNMTIIDEAMTPQRFEARLRSEYQKEPVDAVIVDYLQRGQKHGSQKDYEMITDFSMRCTDLAKELNLIMIVGAQFNRDGAMDSNYQQERRPQLHQIKGSGQIEQDAHVAIAPMRPYNDDGTRSNDAKLFLLKQREGAADIPALPVIFMPDKMSFEVKASV